MIKSASWMAQWVGWAKRSVPTRKRRVGRHGGRGAKSAALPTLPLNSSEHRCPHARRSATKRAAALSTPALPPNGASVVSASPTGRTASARLVDAEDRDGGRLVGVGVLAGRLADRGGVALDIENVVGDLERLADNGPEAVERGAFGASASPRIAPASSRSATARRSSSPAIPRPRQAKPRRRAGETAFGLKVQHLSAGHAAESRRRARAR